MGNFISIANVKSELVDSTIGTDYDILLTSIVAAIESLWDELTGRTWYTTIHTEYINIIPGQKSFGVANFPITSVTSIYNDAVREYGATDLLSSSDYAVVEETGMIFYDYTLDHGPKAIKITYTAGYTSNTIPAFIKQLLIRQCAHWWKQAKDNMWHVSEYDQGSAIQRFKEKFNLLTDFVEFAEKNSMRSYA